MMENSTRTSLIPALARPGETGVHYEIFVRAFADANHDGIGDLPGLTGKLDYLHSLGVSALWLMPVNPSPTYHKYDVTDYYDIDPEYGTLADYRRLVAEAHRRGMAVLLDLVIHHTSVGHPWFEQAAADPAGPYRSFYHWLTPAEIDRRQVATRDITADSGERNPWHRPRGLPQPNGERYYGMFWSGMPDLNFDHPPLREEVFRLVRYWLTDIGVDGFRLDAARHLYRETDEPKNHQFWAEFGRVVETAKPGAYTVGEVWTRPSRIAPYFRGLRANFDFDLCLALYKLVREETDSEDIVEYLVENEAIYHAVNPQFLNAIMLSNHDQERVGSQLRGYPAHLRVAASLLLTLPGVPYLYYGEEIGMLGRKPDENLREPFLWDIAQRDPARTRWRRAIHSTSKTVVPLAAQLADPGSLVHHYKRLIAVRNSHPVLNDNQSRIRTAGIRQTGLLGFRRQSANGAAVLVVHNLSRHTRTVNIWPANAGFSGVSFSLTKGAALLNGRLTLPPYSFVVIDPGR
jgi:alpha-amylase